MQYPGSGFRHAQILGAQTPGLHRQPWWSVVFYISLFYISLLCCLCSEKLTWTRTLSWPNLVLRNWEGRNPTKPSNQKYTTFFLPKFSKCHQVQTRRRWQIRRAGFSHQPSLPQGSPSTRFVITCYILHMHSGRVLLQQVPKPCQLPLMKDKTPRKEDQKMEIGCRNPSK